MCNILVIWLLILPFLSTGQGDIIVNEAFDYPDGPLSRGWWSEGCSGAIKDGRLYVDANTASYRMSTIWLDKEIEGSFSIEYDVHIVSSEGNKNNLNCLLLYSDPAGKPLRETRMERENGKYSYYHKLDGYIITYLANGNVDNARCRFRLNPGFRLIHEGFGYHCRIGRTYHFKIEKRENLFKCWIDGNLVLNYLSGTGNALPEKGLFAFRTWQTSLWWDNLKIKQL